MTYRGTIWLLTLIFTAGLVPSSRAAETYELTVSANRTQLYTGESVVLTVRVGGSLRPPEPDLSAIRGFTVEPLGSHPRSQRSITVVNGRLTQTGFSGREFTYRLTPLAAGTYTLGPVLLQTDSGQLREAGPRVTVSGIEAQDWVSIAVESSRDAVLVGESFEIVVTLALRKLPPPYAEHHPLDVETAPSLTVPFLEWDDIKGLELPDTRTLLQDMLVSRRDQPGFAINNFTVRSDPFDSPFSFTPFADPRPARFMLKRAPTTPANSDYHVYKMSLTYTARREGQHTFGPITFKGPVITDVAAGGRITRKPVFAVGPAFTVRVVPPPEQGRPASYIGAIGTNLSVTAALDTQTCMVGDPLTLTLTLAGDVCMENVRTPDLAAQASIAERFRVYSDTVESRETAEGKTYRYTIRPTRDGTYEFPPIEISYYDSKARAYRTVRSEPVPMRVNKAVDVSVTDIVNTATGLTGRIAFRSNAEDVIAGVTMVPSGYRTASPMASRTVHIAALAGPAWLLLVIVFLIVRRLIRLSDGGRRRRALPSALAELRRIRAADANQAGDHAAAAMRAFMAAHFTVSENGLTPDRAASLMREKSVPPAAIDDFIAAYERAFNLAFSPNPPSEAEVTAMSAACEAAVRSVSAAHATGRVPRVAALIMILGLPLSQAFSADSLEREFLWDEGNALMAGAESPTDYRQAAETYRRLILTGLRNPALFYNYGTALLAAGERRAALQAFERAERYAGTRPDIRRNMAIAAHDEQGDTTELAWYRVPLFWHFGLALEIRLIACAAAFSLLFIALSLRLLGRRRQARVVAMTGIVLIVHFGTSVAASLHAEQQAGRELRVASPWTTDSEVSP